MLRGDTKITIISNRAEELSGGTPPPWPPDIDGILEAKVVVVVSQEVTNGGVIPAHDDRVGFGLEGVRGGGLLMCIYFIDKYTTLYYSVIAYLKYVNMKYIPKINFAFTSTYTTQIYHTYQTTLLL